MKLYTVKLCETQTVQAEADSVADAIADAIDGNGQVDEPELVVRSAGLGNCRAKAVDVDVSRDVQHVSCHPLDEVDFGDLAFKQNP